jgi:uncharacterized protein YggE
MEPIMGIFFIFALLGIANCGSIAETSNETLRQVRVSGMGETKVEADIARAHLSAQSQRQTSTEAKDDCADRE